MPGGYQKTALRGRLQLQMVMEIDGLAGEEGRTNGDQAQAKNGHMSGQK
jgi:hypothetical protein